MNPLTYFAPDANPLTKGIVAGGTNFYPSESGGFKPTPTIVAIADALPDICKGCRSLETTNGDYITVLGTSSHLYQLNVHSLVDVTPVVPYSGASNWQFTVFGNLILAIDYNVTLQVQTVSGSAFAEVTGAPKAKFMVANQYFVVVGNVNSQNARVQWCAQGDYTDWTPSLSTQAGYKDLDDTPGPITGLACLGNYILVAKERALYLGSYTGPPYVWSFQRVPVFSGCVAGNGMIEMEGAVYYPGLDDFYRYDGTVPVGIGSGIRNWWLGRMDMVNRPVTQGVYDPLRRQLIWIYPTSADATGYPAEALIYDLRQKRWGTMSLPCELGMILWSPGVTYGTISTFFATYAAITASGLTYGSPWWSQSAFGVALVDRNHVLSLICGTPGASSIITGDLGEMGRQSQVQSFWPGFNLNPTTCAVTARTKTTAGGTATNGGSGSIKADGTVDLIQTGKFISFELAMTGDYEISGFDTDIKPVSVN